MKKFALLLITFLSTLAITTPAHAGFVLPIIAGALIGASAATFIGVTVLTAAAIGAAAGLVVSLVAPDLFGGMFDVPDYNVTQNAQAANDGVKLNKTGMLENIPVVYGQRKVGGKVVFLTTSGDRNKYLYMALVLSEGEIDSIGDIYINDVISTDSRFSGRVEIQKFYGTDNQAASSLLLNAPGWTNNHKLSGIAYLAIRFEWKKIEKQEDADANPFSGIPKVNAVIKGKKVKPCGGLTNSHSTTYYNETGLGFSNNPADCILDYMRNPRYGRGLSNDRINFESFSTARAKYATIVTYNTGVRGPVLNCNAVIDTSRSLLDNIKVFLANARSGMPYVQGRFKLKLDDTGHETDGQNPTPAILPIPGTTDNKVSMKHIVGGMKIQGNGTREHFNQVKITYIDPTNEWKTNEVIYPELNSGPDQVYLAEDNGRRLTKEMAFNHIIDKNQAADLAHIILTQSRSRKNIAFDATAELHEAEVGDIIAVDYAPLAIDANYRIRTIKVNADYTVSITAQEHTATNYVFSDTNTVYGSSNQLKYVDNIAQGKYYVPQEDGTYESVTTPPPNANEPTIPINTPAVTNNTLRINSFTEVYRNDTLSAATINGTSIKGRISVKAFIVVSDIIADGAIRIDVDEYSALDRTWKNAIHGAFVPSSAPVEGSYYIHRIGITMDGSNHKFRLTAIMDNGDRLPSGEFVFTAPLSKYNNSKIVTF